MKNCRNFSCYYISIVIALPILITSHEAYSIPPSPAVSVKASTPETSFAIGSEIQIPLSTTSKTELSYKVKTYEVVVDSNLEDLVVIDINQKEIKFKVNAPGEFIIEIEAIKKDWPNSTRGFIAIHAEDTQVWTSGSTVDAAIRKKIASHVQQKHPNIPKIFLKKFYKKSLRAEERKRQSIARIRQNTFN